MRKTETGTGRKAKAIPSLKGDPEGKSAARPARPKKTASTPVAGRAGSRQEDSAPAPRRRNRTAATKQQRTTRVSDTEAQRYEWRRKRPRRPVAGLSGAGSEGSSSVRSPHRMKRRNQVSSGAVWKGAESASPPRFGIVRTTFPGHVHDPTPRGPA